MLSMDSTFMLLVYVVPMIAIFSTGLLLFLWIMLPGQAKTFLSARMPWNKGKVLVENLDEAGQVDYELLHPSGEGLLKNPGRSIYKFIPTVVRDRRLRNYNELAKKRSVVKGLGVPLYHSISGTSIAAPPELVSVLERAGEAETNLEKEKEEGVTLKKYTMDELLAMIEEDLKYLIEEYELTKKLRKYMKPDTFEKDVVVAAILQAQETLKDVQLYNPLNTLKEWVSLAWPIETISLIRHEWEEYGRYGRPTSTLKKMIIPIGLIMVLLVLYLVFKDSNIRLPTIRPQGT